MLVLGIECHMKEQLGRCDIFTFCRDGHSDSTAPGAKHTIEHGETQQGLASRAG